jgi:hypothetical protein
MPKVVIVNGRKFVFSDRAVMGAEVLASMGVFGTPPKRTNNQ